MSENRPELGHKLTAGHLVGDYRIERSLGSGGMADVYYAIDQRLDRAVALKVLRTVLADDSTYQQRFQQEAKAAAALVHPNIVQIYNIGQDGLLRYIAQEYIPGINLRSYLADQVSELSPPNESAPIDESSNPNFNAKPGRQLPIAETISILLQVLAALNKSANAGIIHRDIKPENIMLTRDGEVKVTDFGLAHIQMGDDLQLTHPGTTLGTPMYMSPEQIQGGPLDIRSDLYSLGVTLFHVLYGRPPFQGETALALAMQHVQAPLPDLEPLREDVPKSLQKLLRRLLAKAPADRFSSPSQVLDYLYEHHRQDLVKCWPDRIIPMPDVSLLQQRSHQPELNAATQKLQTLLAAAPSTSRTSWATLILVVSALLGLAFWVGLRGAGLAKLGLSWPAPDQILAVKQAVYQDIPRQSDVRQQYVWALLNQSSGRVAIWEAVGHYFPASGDPMNRLYGGLAQLQMARLFEKAGDLDQATRRLVSITHDRQMLPLIQAYAWLELAIVERSRDHRDAMKQNVRKALDLRSKINSKKDLEQLDQAVRDMPSDIELYWTPASSDEENK